MIGSLNHGNASSPRLVPAGDKTSSPMLRASSYRSSKGSITPLRRSSSVASIIPESDMILDATMKGEPFQLAVLKVLIKLKLTSWKLSQAQDVKIKTIASALTNDVFLVILDTQKFLLRVYGRNVLHLIDREYETSVLARLAHHRIGPRMLGQFKNGRIEQWLESTEMTAAELRDPVQSRYIARRMREFHDFVSLLPAERGRATVLSNLDCWIPALPADRLTPGVKTFLEHVARYRQMLIGKEGEIVFGHNDLQYGNILKIDGEEHTSLAVIDFEYAGPNPRAFDLANHFAEWMANYHEEPSHTMLPELYPTLQEQDNFLREYIRFGKVIDRMLDQEVTQEEIDVLRAEIDLWRAISHAQWAVWGIIQALPPAEQVTTNVNSVESPKSPQDDKVDRGLSKRRGSKGRTLSMTQSPMMKPTIVTGGMRSPFLPAQASPQMLARRSSSYKSPSTFAVVHEQPEYFDLGEAAIPDSAKRLETLTMDDPAARAVAAASAAEATNTGIAGDEGVLLRDESQESWVDEGEEGFNYNAYAKQRISLFYGDMVRAGVVAAEEVPAALGLRMLPECCVK
ncbi:kinase-like domain-containing protein [Protomyces lactucae-debilis]|uniref:Kinase-like domain-containing protein n=1 Tax=Protomyces lactucae-debilis TaxID=2754530 RepID=A0A1Y2ES05_PROLT|nr:kinase-like domain-containing protein [Protomyces lactucae-debilis]ORY74348.1 kinase-like domain-containing protein [Protomyces lactucae-debilis]